MVKLVEIVTDVCDWEITPSIPPCIPVTKQLFDYNEQLAVNFLGREHHSITELYGEFEYFFSYIYRRITKMYSIKII